MIQTLKKGETSLNTLEGQSLDAEAIKESLWIDLNSPTAGEREVVEKALGVSLPTEDEMQEIEESSRLFEEDGAIFMSCWLLCYDSPIPVNASVTFIVTESHFISIRHTDHHAFRVFHNARKRQQARRRFRDSGDVFAEIMDSITNHIAYTLRLVEQDLNDLSVQIFSEQAGQLKQSQKIGLKRVVKRLGKRNSLVANLRESSVSLSTMTPFIVTNGPGLITPGVSARLTALQRDVNSLGEYNTQLSAEIAFLLDSTVGLINFEQNQMMKWIGAAALLVAFI